MAQRYAQNTEVNTDKSKAEIERILARYGASEFLQGWDQFKAVLAFRMCGLMIRLEMPLPDRGSEEFTLTPTRKWERTPEESAKTYEQAIRQRWRALALVVKAKLEAIDLGITTFEEEFLANIVLPDNSRVGDFMLPQVATTYENGQMPKMLPGPHRDP